MHLSRLTAARATLVAALFSIGLAGTALVTPAWAVPAAVAGTVSIQTTGFLVGDDWYSSVTTDPPGATVDYQWLRSGAPIEDADGGTYEATSDDVGSDISLRVVISDGVDETTLVSQAYGPVLTEYPGGDDEEGDDELDTFDAYRPLILGKVRVGSTVRVETDPEDYDETTTLAYQWLVNGQPARKGTGTTFKLKKKFKGKLVSVQVTASEPGYETETVISRPKKVLR